MDTEYMNIRLPSLKTIVKERRMELIFAYLKSVVIYLCKLELIFVFFHNYIKTVIGKQK